MSAMWSRRLQKSERWSRLISSEHSIYEAGSKDNESVDGSDTGFDDSFISNGSEYPGRRLNVEFCGCGWGQRTSIDPPTVLTGTSSELRGTCTSAVWTESRHP